MQMRKELYSDVSVKGDTSIINQGKIFAFTKETMMNANFLYADSEDGRAQNNQQSRALPEVDEDKQRLSSITVKR